jgi:hypothetical protein
MVIGVEPSGERGIDSDGRGLERGRIHAFPMIRFVAGLVEPGSGLWQKSLMRRELKRRRFAYFLK